jgi:site-specific DNA-methyltransferase (adenine-specific)/modification methylase
LTFRKEVLAEGVECILGDCAQILPTLSAFDAVVTDPPYGIGADQWMAKDSGNKRRNSAASKGVYRHTDWDVRPISPAVMEMVQSSARWNIIFGGNYYSLPASTCWLVWDKENGDNGFADCELAWTNLPKAVRRIKWMWNGMLRKNGEEREGHPTQKPLEVMKWAIGHLPPPNFSILDPFMGSGTTGVACVNLGKQFTGIERERKYFDIACERIARAQAQERLFA